MSPSYPTRIREGKSVVEEEEEEAAEEKLKVTAFKCLIKRYFPFISVHFHARYSF